MRSGAFLDRIIFWRPQKCPLLKVLVYFSQSTCLFHVKYLFVPCKLLVLLK